MLNPADYCHNLTRLPRRALRKPVSPPMTAPGPALPNDGSESAPGRMEKHGSTGPHPPILAFNDPTISKPAPTPILPLPPKREPSASSGEPVCRTTNAAFWLARNGSTVIVEGEPIDPDLLRSSLLPNISVMTIIAKAKSGMDPARRSEFRHSFIETRRNPLQGSLAYPPTAGATHIT